MSDLGGRMERNRRLRNRSRHSSVPSEAGEIIAKIGGMVVILGVSVSIGLGVRGCVKGLAKEQLQDNQEQKAPNFTNSPEEKLREIEDESKAQRSKSEAAEEIYKSKPIMQISNP